MMRALARLAAFVAIPSACVWSPALASGPFFSTSAALAPAHMSASERAYARTIAPASANEVTANLIKNIGKRVAFICTVTAIVHPDTMIGQCGRDAEPIDMYVLTPTKGYTVGTKLRVLGEMAPPGQWVDVTGHSWFTPFVKAKFADRI
jgi:hypothetical protein